MALTDSKLKCHLITLSSCTPFTRVGFRKKKIKVNNFLFPNDSDVLLTCPHKKRPREPSPCTASSLHSENLLWQTI